MKVPKYYDPTAESGGAEDVNSGDAPESSAGIEVEGNPSAETLNTDAGNELPETIPYDRFKEVNDQYKELKEKAEMYKVYEQFDQKLSEDQDLYKKFESLFEAPADNEGADPTTELSRKLEAIESQMAQSKIDNMNTSYKTAYQSLAKELPDEEKAVYDILVETELFKLAKGNPYQNYNVKNIETAFGNVQSLLDKVYKAKNAKYVSDKGDPLPSNKGGAVPSKSPPKVLGSHEAQAERAKELLKAGKQGG